jgi:hypothetical protein
MLTPLFKKINKIFEFPVQSNSVIQYHWNSACKCLVWKFKIQVQLALQTALFNQSNGYWRFPNLFICTCWKPQNYSTDQLNIYKLILSSAKLLVQVSVSDLTLLLFSCSVPQLNRVAKKLGTECAPAMIAVGTSTLVVHTRRTMDGSFAPSSSSRMLFVTPTTRFVTH